MKNSYFSEGASKILLKFAGKVYVGARTANGWIHGRADENFLEITLGTQTRNKKKSNFKTKTSLSHTPHTPMVCEKVKICFRASHRTRDIGNTRVRSVWSR